MCLEPNDGYLETRMTVQDLDWFACDKNGKIAHFATGGSGFVLSRMLENMTRLDPVFEDLFQQQEITECEIFEDNLPDLQSVQDRERYIATFASYARKGFYSFDVIDLSVRNSGYKLVAAPASPIDIGCLSEDTKELQDILCMKNQTLSKSSRFIQISYFD